MKLILQKDQKSGFSKTTYILEAKVELTEDEAENVKKYKVGKTLLYTNMSDRGSGMLGIAYRSLAGTEITIGDLIKGKKVEIKDIFEMIGLEDQVKEACEQFKLVLETMASFGGDEVIEF